MNIYFKVYNLRALGHFGLNGLALNKLIFPTIRKGLFDFTGTYTSNKDLFGISDNRILLS